MKPDYPGGDILIKRVTNGWLAVVGSEYSEGETCTYVYEDSDTAVNDMAESLFSLIADQFECYLQSRRQPGIDINYKDTSREDEENVNS